MDMHRIEKSAGAGLTTIGKLIQENKVESNKVRKQLLYRQTFFFFNDSIMFSKLRNI